MCILLVADPMREAVSDTAFLPLHRLPIGFAIPAMKRCPECHFTFEDRVQVCDFDSSELTPIADPAPLSDRIVRPSKKSKLIRYANFRIGLAGLVVLLLVSGLFLIVRQRSSSPPKVIEKAWTAERHDSIVSTAPIRKSRRRISNAHKPDRRSRATIARASTPRRISIRTTARVRSSPVDLSKQTVVLPEKKESKLNVVFKKTGNALKKTLSILKKPFEL